jgi:hypothetical protein
MNHLGDFLLRLLVTFAWSKHSPYKLFDRQTINRSPKNVTLKFVPILTLKNHAYSKALRHATT